MGKSVTCNYEVQVHNLLTDRLHLIGAMNFKEAKDKLLAEAQRIGAVTGYIWAQTKIAEKIINRNGADYLKVTITVNTPERTVYTIAGVNILTS